MAIFRNNPIEFEAIQFTGDNFDELREFVGTRIAPYDGHPIEIFNPIGTYLPEHFYNHEEDPPTAELWVDKYRAWEAIYLNEWIVKDERGFHSCRDDIMWQNNTKVRD